MDIDEVDDAVAAAAFRRLVRHLQHREDAANIDLMILAGFCRNCLGDWLAEGMGATDTAPTREAVHGMSAADWKARQTPATPEQMIRMAASIGKNGDAAPPRG